MRVRTVSATLLLALSLAACSEDPGEPSALPTLDTSPSASASGSAEPAASGIDAATPDGAGAFARHWYAEIEAAFATRDPQRVQALSAPGCAACEQYIASLTRLRDKNERVDDYQIDVVAAEAPAFEGADEVKVTVVYNTEGATRYDASGAVVREDPPRQLVEQTLVLVRTGETWKVREVVV